MMEDIKMLEFAKIDMDTWARREHYIYYTEKLKIEFNMTANRNLWRDFLNFPYFTGFPAP